MKVLTQTVYLSVIYVAIATMVHMSIVMLAGTARPFLEGHRSSRVIRRVMAFVLAGIALWFGVATRR